MSRILYKPLVKVLNVYFGIFWIDKNKALIGLLKESKISYLPVVIKQISLKIWNYNSMNDLSN